MGQGGWPIRKGFGALALLLAVGLPVVAHAAGEVLAELDGVAITAEEVEKAIGAPLRKLEEQIYDLKRETVEAMIAERLLAREAAKRGMSVQALLDAEVTPKVGLVTEQEIETFYQANKAQLKGEEEATIREQIRTYLQNQRLVAQREAFVRSLRSQAKVAVHLKTPPVFRAQVAVDGAPFKGSATAPVTIVEFSDFQCPFCKRVQPTLTQLLTRYSDKIKLVYRDFPLDSLHPEARKAAEAARCANDQGKFWPYHDLLYAGAPKAGPEQLKAHARTAGLDLSAFEQCLSSGKYQAAVQKDVEDGARAGVTGTPAFFVNGRALTGAQPLDSFIRVVEEELARTR